MLRGVSGYPQDQVPRRLQFEKDHPSVRITFLGPAWQAVVPTEQGEDVITRYDPAAAARCPGEARLAAVDGPPGLQGPGGLSRARP
jgi:hypothetical protein